MGMVHAIGPGFRELNIGMYVPTSLAKTLLTVEIRDNKCMVLHEGRNWTQICQPLVRTRGYRRIMGSSYWQIRMAY